MNNIQKQVILSGILGDGCLLKNGVMSFSCIHKEYMNLKSKLLGSLSPPPTKIKNSGYKKSFIYKLRANRNSFGRQLNNKGLSEFINDLDELGLALWFYDDGSRHHKNNFYNISTHSFTKEQEEGILIPLLNKFNIYPEILIETKKDSRVFSYLYIPKWKGAMEMSRLMRKLNLKCYKYKLIPKNIEDLYFEVKDTEEWRSLKTPTSKTLYIKKLLKVPHKIILGKNQEHPRYINSDNLVFD